MTRIAVRPGAGRRVRLPGQEAPIPADGQEVDLDLFVRRRLDDGDLVRVTDKAGEPREKKAKS